MERVTSDIRDYQKSKVYAWEREVIDPKGNTPVPYGQVQSLVDYVWSQEGLQYPPKVEPLPRQTRRACATGSRTTLRFPPDRDTTTAIVLHELAHSLTSKPDHESAWHGPVFVGAYMHLAAKYLNAPIAMLWYTAAQNGVDYEPYAGPLFLREPEFRY